MDKTEISELLESEPVTNFMPKSDSQTKMFSNIADINLICYIWRRNQIACLKVVWFSSSVVQNSEVPTITIIKLISLPPGPGPNARKYISLPCLPLISNKYFVENTQSVMMSTNRKGPRMWQLVLKIITRKRGIICCKNP